MEELINHKYPKEVEILSFEVFWQSFTSGFPLNTFQMTSDYNEVFGHPLPVDSRLMQPEHVYPRRFKDKYESLDVAEIPIQEFITWFAKRWQRAGGGSFPLRAEISPNDNHEFSTSKKEFGSPFAR